MSYGSLAEVSEIIEFMTQILYLTPTCRTFPIVWMFWIHCAESVQITVWFLSACNDSNHRIAILIKTLSLESSIRVSLHQIAGTFKSLVRVSIIKRISMLINFKHLAWILYMLSSTREILISVCFFTLTESQWYSDIATGLETLSPESVLTNFYTCERHLSNWITILVVLGICSYSYA